MGTLCNEDGDANNDGKKTTVNAITARWNASSRAPACSCRLNYNVKRPFLLLNTVERKKLPKIM